MTTRSGALATGITGGLSADSSKSATQASLAFAGSGSFAPQAYIPARAIISFAEIEFTESAAANTLFPRFNGIGNLSAYARLNGQIAVTYAGAGNLSAFATQGQAAAARFIGAGNLSADSSKSKSAAATYSGLGNLTADSDLNQAVQVRFAGAGNFSATGIVVKSAAATLAAAGNLTASVVSGQCGSGEIFWHRKYKC